MNIRWLWLNHVPAGLTLTHDERIDVLKHARRRRTMEPGYRIASTGSRLFLSATLTALSVLFAGWIVVLIKLRLRGAEFILSNIGGILIFNALMWACITWAYYRTNAPFIRWALWEIGKPVCINCGYILIAAVDPLQPCPECGTRHELVQGKQPHSS